MSDERARELGRVLRKYYRDSDPLIGPIWPDVAQGIIANPQRLVDALVEAGVLRELLAAADGSHLYEVVQSHKHAWFVVRADGAQYERVKLECSTCPEFRIVPNRLPVEAPE